MRRREERRKGKGGKREIYLSIKLMIIRAHSLNFPGIMLIFGTTSDGKLVSGMGSIKASH